VTAEIEDHTNNSTNRSALVNQMTRACGADVAVAAREVIDTAVLAVLRAL
jgi:hypothetical protein